MEDLQVLRIGKTLAINQTVKISIWGSQPLYEWNLVSHGLSTKTDSNGRFVFPRVAPIEEVRNYEFPVQPDGTFRVEDVLPGSYRMQVRADAPVVAGHPARHAAVAEVKVTVPEVSAGETEPLDVGTLTPVRAG